jgi:hypothetical protein
MPLQWASDVAIRCWPKGITVEPAPTCKETHLEAMPTIVCKWRDGCACYMDQRAHFRELTDLFWTSAHETIMWTRSGASTRRRWPNGGNSWPFGQDLAGRPTIVAVCNRFSLAASNRHAEGNDGCMDARWQHERGLRGTFSQDSKSISTPPSHLQVVKGSSPLHTLTPSFGEKSSQDVVALPLCRVGRV